MPLPLHGDFSMLKSKIAVVTGSTFGTGLAIARGCAADGGWTAQ